MPDRGNSGCCISLPGILKTGRDTITPGSLSAAESCLRESSLLQPRSSIHLFINDLYAFFGQASVTQTVMDAMAWSPAEAWQAFNYGLILMAGGILVALYNNLRDERPHEIFALVWALVILFSTWQHVRYEYYLAVVIALLSAVCVHFIFEKGWGDLRTLASDIMPHAASEGADEAEKDQPRRGKGQKQQEKVRAIPENWTIRFLGLW